MTRTVTVSQHSRSLPQKPPRPEEFYEMTEKLRREVVKLRRVRVKAGRG